MAKLQAQIILEILGRPKEHVVQALESLVTKLASEKGVTVTEKTLHEPKHLEGKQELYTSFADLMLELDSIENYFGILFAYMPSNIELIHPEKITLQNDELSVMANQILRRLHEYDAIAKKMIADKDILLRKLAEVAPELFKKGAVPKIQEKETLGKAKSKKKSKKKTTKKKSKKK